MQGTFDEASLRLARALQRSPEHVEAALQDVGVDAPYLARALADGDPQGAIDAVSLRLGVPQRELVLALIRAGGAEGDSRKVADALRASSAEPAAPLPEALHDLLAERLPALLSRAAAVSLGVGAALGALASVALWRPDLFRALLVYAAAGILGAASLLLLFAAWRMRRAARGLRLARTRRAGAKR